MNVQQRVSVPNDMRTWTNDRSPVPDWVRAHMAGRIAPNGTFLISTPVGTARVHVGNVVVEHCGELWSRASDEVPQLVEELKAATAPAAAAIGPGKSAQFGSECKTGRGKKRGAERKLAFRPPCGSMPSIEWVHTSELTVDQSYQRSIDNAGSRRLITSIAANFDWRLCAPLVVSRRANGSKIIIDGQHRWAAAVRRGDLPQLPCCLFTYANPEDEARMFIVANRARKPMNRLDDFHAALAAADEDASEILRLVNEAGLAIARNTSSSAWKPGEVVFTSSIATALRRYGDAIVSGALTCMAEAFEGQSLTQGASVFGALVRIFANPPEGFDSDRLVPLLRQLNAAGLGKIVQEQKGGDSRVVAIRAAMVKMMSDLDGMPSMA